MRLQVNTSISEFERNVLEKLFGHEAVEVLWSIDSRSARILGVREARGPMVVKMPGWRTLEVLSPDERLAGANTMNRATTAFHTRLMDLGVTLPNFYQMSEVNGFPVHLSSDHGEDCAQIVRRDQGQLQGILEKIVRNLNGVFERGNAQIGIDARLSNFALSQDGEIIYIDIFPPLIYFEGQYFVHFPNPTVLEEVSIEIDRKFKPLGILRRLRFDLLAVNPAWHECFFQTLDMVENIHLRANLKVRFQNLPDQLVGQMSRQERHDLLKSLPFGDVDSCREIAAQLIPMGELRDPVMNQVFAATSFVGVSNAERLARWERFQQIIDPFL